MTCCTCIPCTTPAYGAPGHAHCAACCWGTGIVEYDHDCPEPEHRDMAERQFPTANEVTPVAAALRSGGVPGDDG